MDMTADELLAFEEDIAEEFRKGNIRSPIHLSKGNELELIELFKEIKPDDWVLCGWRSHFHCLLKGVPKDVVKSAILGGRSVSLCFPHFHILSSGIVGGISPIAAGIAWALKRKNDEAFGLTSSVYCFLGDMSAESGIVHESMKYVARHDLPVKFVIEDNGISVGTNTHASWGEHVNRPEVYRYFYKLDRPHAGIGEWIAMQ